LRRRNGGRQLQPPPITGASELAQGEKVNLDHILAIVEIVVILVKEKYIREKYKKYVRRGRFSFGSWIALAHWRACV
jgi:hypothetical protein